jgi:hypothetical protein
MFKQNFKSIKSECMLVIILKVQNEQSQKVLTKMTKENIEFELNNGWQKRLIVCAIQNHVLHKDK